MCVCVRACIRVCARAFVCARVRVWACVRAHECVCVRARACVRACVCACVGVRDSVCMDIGVRANIHLGGQTEFCPNGFSGGGGSSRNFPVVAEIFRDPYYVGGRIFSVNGSGRP